MSQQKPRDNSRLIRNAASLSGIAIQMGATIYLGNLLGSWLDGKFNTAFLEPAVTLLAVFLSMYVIIKAVKDLNS